MNNELELLVDMLPFLIPIFIVEIALLVFALLDLLKREYMSTNTKVIWILVIVLFSIIGPVVYFIFGRKESPIDSDKD